jgi:DNA-binding response OmpR family regulator
MAKRILIVDDDLSVRTLFSETLTSEGFEVSTAADGEQGLARLIEGGFDLVLLDVMMPKIDGLGILTELQTHPPKVKNGKIIMFTSLHDDPAVTEGMTKGAAGAIVKSDFTPDILLKKIKELLQ